MSNADSFLTGFFGAIKGIQDENRQRANTFYDRQLERAQTIGVEKLQARRAKSAQANEVSQRLMSQGNIPPDVIREAAKGGLDGLGQLEEIWKSAASDGIPTNEMFWRDVYKVAKDSSTDSPLVPTMGEVIKATTNPPQEPKRKRSFGDIVFGKDSVERAAERLDDVEVVEGYSAADLLALQDEPETTTQGSIDWGSFYDKAQAAKTAQEEIEEQKEASEPLSINNINTLMTPFRDKVSAKITSAVSSGTLSAGTPEYEEAREAIRESAEEEVFREFAQDYPQEDLLKIPSLRQIAERVAAKESEQAGAIAQPNITPEPTASPTKPEGFLERVNVAGQGVATFSHMNKLGRPVYQMPDGSLKTVNPELVTDPNKVAPESTRQAQDTQARLSSAINSLMSGQEPEGFFIGAGETPPQNIPSPQGAGSLVLKTEIEEGYIYGNANDDSEDMLIPKQ